VVVVDAARAICWLLSKREEKNEKEEMWAGNERHGGIP
jgi:hypothetical protein